MIGCANEYSLGSMRNPFVYVTAVFLFALAIVASFVETIPPQDMSRTAMIETLIRFQMYVSERRDYPKDLSSLPKRKGHGNRITDGWGHPLLYDVDQTGVVSLTSLGRDGKVGGSGENADIIERRNTRTLDGTLNVDDELWVVRSRVQSL